jgi:hypothetical protein
LLRDRFQRALLVRRLAAGPERELEGEDADDPVDHAAAKPPRASHSKALLCATFSPCRSAFSTGLGVLGACAVTVLLSGAGL